MKLGRLNHVGVATPSIENSLDLYRTMFGAEPHGEPFDLPLAGYFFFGAPVVEGGDLFVVGESTVGSTQPTRWCELYVR